jgi:hypothetical protein
MENKSFYEKLAKAKLNFKPIVKNKKGQSGNQIYWYADLGTILDSTEKYLLEQGLVLHSSVSDVEGKKEVVTSLSDGVHSISSKFELINLEIKTSKNGFEKLNIQEVGSAISYARRYNIVALLNVVADDDDDGSSAINKVKPEPKLEKPTIQSGKIFSLEEFNLINNYNELQQYYASLDKSQQEKFKNLIIEKGSLCKVLEQFNNIGAFNAWYLGLKEDIKLNYRTKYNALLDVHMQRLEKINEERE